MQSLESIGLLTDFLIKLDGLFSLQRRLVFTPNTQSGNQVLHIHPMIYDKIYSVCLLVKFRESSVGSVSINELVCIYMRVMPFITWLTMYSSVYTD